MNFFDNIPNFNGNNGIQSMNPPIMNNPMINNDINYKINEARNQKVRQVHHKVHS